MFWIVTKKEKGLSTRFIYQFKSSHVNKEPIRRWKNRWRQVSNGEAVNGKQNMEDGGRRSWVSFKEDLLKRVLGVLKDSEKRTKSPRCAGERVLVWGSLLAKAKNETQRRS